MSLQPYKPTLAFYRRLLHTMMKSFVGDYNMFHQIRLEARRKILENKNETDEIKIQKMIFFGEESRDFLEKNLIQASLQDTGRYRLNVRKEHAMGTTIKN